MKTKIPCVEKDCPNEPPTPGLKSCCTQNGVCGYQSNNETTCEPISCDIDKCPKDLSDSDGRLTNCCATDRRCGYLDDDSIEDMLLQAGLPAELVGELLKTESSGVDSAADVLSGEHISTVDGSEGVGGDIVQDISTAIYHLLISGSKDLLEHDLQGIGQHVLYLLFQHGLGDDLWAELGDYLRGQLGDDLGNQLGDYFKEHLVDTLKEFLKNHLGNDSHPPTVEDILNGIRQGLLEGPAGSDSLADRLDKIEGGIRGVDPDEFEQRILKRGLEGGLLENLYSDLKNGAVGDLLKDLKGDILEEALGGDILGGLLGGLKNGLENDLTGGILGDIQDSSKQGTGSGELLGGFLSNLLVGDILGGDGDSQTGDLVGALPGGGFLESFMGGDGPLGEGSFLGGLLEGESLVELIGDDGILVGPPGVDLLEGLENSLWQYIDSDVTPAAEFLSKVMEANFGNQPLVEAIRRALLEIPKDAVIRTSQHCNPNIRTPTPCLTQGQECNGIVGPQCCSTTQSLICPGTPDNRPRLCRHSSFKCHEKGESCRSNFECCGGKCRGHEKKLIDICM